ncbi:MAG: MaoC/PaaZ C-terminal domain-containing protein [Zwartia sp.]|jgi:acyl dehydratase
MDYHNIKNWKFPEVDQTYTENDSILYALGIGFGQEPTNPQQLKYVYEKNMQTFPTMAVVLGYPGFWMKDPKAGVNWVKLVHGEQRLKIHRTLPTSGRVIGRGRITHVIDKGADKGALVLSERTLHDPEGNLYVTLASTTFCRGDGGLSQSDEAPTALQATPERAPDLVCELPTLPQAALIYRLCADNNPLHADLEVAANAGFPRPILHGLCTYGVAARAIVQAACNNDATRLTQMDTRFSSPVFPGETLVCEMWREGTEAIRFRAKVKERDIMVLSHGYAGIKA